MDRKLEDYLYETKLTSNEIKMLFAFDVDIGTKLFNPKSFDGLGRVIGEEQPDVIIFSQIQIHLWLFLEIKCPVHF